MRAYRFLAEGAKSPRNGFVWPTPRAATPTESGVHAAWIAPPADATTFGISAYRVRDLPYWLEAELWEVELRGNYRLLSNQVLADEARLVARVPGWDAEVMMDFTIACVERLRQQAIGLFRREGHDTLADELARTPLLPPAECAKVVAQVKAKTHGDASALIAGYWEDTLANLAAREMRTVAYIVHVASVDARLAPVGELSERQVQAAWIREKLHLESTAGT